MRRFVAAVLSLELTACAATVPRPQAPPIPVVIASAWSWQGRISVKSGEEAFSGQLQWQHDPAGDTLMLASPLGQGVAKIVRNSSGVVLDLPGEAPRQAPTVEALTADALGYVLPAAGLAYWVQAQADPDSPFEAIRDDLGRPARISQEGWSIEYLQYQADNPNQPRRLILTRDGLEIRLVTDSWQTE